MTTARARKASPILGAASATIGEASVSLVSATSEFAHSFEVDLSLISADPGQPRRHFDEAALAALAATMQSDGQLQPVLLRPDPVNRGHWIIVAGERRWRAAKRLGWIKLLAINHAGDPEVASLLENLQRVDLSPLEEARGIERLLTEKGWTQEQAARALGRATSDISGTLRILHLPEAVLTQVLTSDTKPAKNVLIELARVEDQAILARLAALAQQGGLTVRAIRQAREERKERADAELREPHTAPEGRPGWGAVVRATHLLTRIAAHGGGVSATELRALRALREAAEAVLAHAGEEGRPT